MAESLETINSIPKAKPKIVGQAKKRIRSKKNDRQRMQSKPAR